MLHCKPAKIIINHSRSDWFSKAITLVWAEPCVWWAELKMLSFWAGGISSFLPCAREYRLLRRLAKPCPPPFLPLYMCCNIHHFGIAKRKVMGSKLQVTLAKLQVTPTKLQVTLTKLQVTSTKLQVTRSKLTSLTAETNKL